MVDIKINKTLRNVLIGVLLIVLLFVIGSLFPDKDFREKYEGFDLSSSTEMQSSTRTYSEYLELYSKKKEAKQTVNVDVFAYDEDKSYGVRIQDDYYGKKVVVTEDRSSITWNVDVQEEGFYNISMEYGCIPSRNVEMERILYINGEVPFSGADILSFARLWKDGGEVKFDNQGNSIRPTQVEYFDFQTVRFKSDLGYEVDPYRFYLKKGVNEITFESTNEPMGIVSFEFVPVQKYDSYEQYLAKQKSKPEDFNKEVEVIKVQGESSQSRSDPSLFARYDRSSAITEPYSVKNTVLNYIGGDSWRAPGQWIEWGFEVPETGWYNISVQARQLFQRGYVACRSVYIDGQIPMQELKSVGFPFSSDWKTTVISDKDENPINFFLTKGKHTIRLEATLGDVG